jgi:hypothetical protein
MRGGGEEAITEEEAITDGGIVLMAGMVRESM